MNGAPSGHERWHDDLAAYALGSLPPAEAEALEHHLETCEGCRERLHWLSPAVGALAESAPPVEPPAALKLRIMAEVDREAGNRPATESRRRRKRLGGLLTKPATGLAAAALLGAGVAGYALHEEGGTQTEEHREAGIGAVLEYEDSAGTLRLTGLEQLDREHLYQAWVQRGPEVVPSSLFAPHSDGTAWAAIPDGLDGADVVMVTVEPRRGSSVPTGEPVISVPMN
ncbi:MAG TPA: anti-sigma factor [Solirubrobacterales bacterium]|nr:anti-sigma factor [Solirubrobacterales bacterium]